MNPVEELPNRFQRVRPWSPPDALNAALRSRGFAVDDFALEEESSSRLSDELGIVGGLLKIRCRSTAEERIYSSGSGSAWLGAFLMDLGRGHFSRAVRSQVSNVLPISLAVRQRLNA
jgi:hypothetical protein